jgi:hypothetical protein
MRIETFKSQDSGPRGGRCRESTPTLWVGQDEPLMEGPLVALR